MTCDATFKITSCVAKWPGSVHDSRMFKDCSLSQKFERGTDPFFLKTYLQFEWILKIDKCQGCTPIIFGLAFLTMFNDKKVDMYYHVWSAS